MIHKRIALILIIQHFLCVSACTDFNSTSCDKCTDALGGTKVSTKIWRHIIHVLIALLCSVFGAIRTRYAENGNGVEATYCQLAQTVVDTTGTIDRVHVRNFSFYLSIVGVFKYSVEGIYINSIRIWEYHILRFFNPLTTIFADKLSSASENSFGQLSHTACEGLYRQGNPCEFLD